MVTLLKHPRGLGIAYQPTAIGNYDCRDSRDDMLHGLLTLKLGTCVSLPVLFVAIGRRLRYPMHLAVANGHVICQWLNDDGTHANLEGSSAGGGSMQPDAYYHSWPHPLTPAHMASGHYLRPFTRAEELALFMDVRARCLSDNGRLPEAREAHDMARAVAPPWPPYDSNMSRLNVRERAQSAHSWLAGLPLFEAIDVRRN